MSAPARGAAGRNALALGALVAFSLPVFFWKLAAYGTINFDEAVYHFIARHMVESGDWTRLVTFGGEHVYDTFTKAPLQHWVRAGLIAGLGDNYWSMRLLSAFFGLATVVAVYGLARQLAGVRAGFLAGFVQLTTFQFVFLHGARTGESDSIVTCLFAVIAWTFARALSGTGPGGDPNGDPRSGWRDHLAHWWPHHAALFLLANVKLPLLLPAALAEVLVLAATSRGRNHARAWLTTALVLAPLAFAWHIGQVIRLGDEAFDVMRKMTQEAAGDEEWAGPKGSAVENALLYGRVLIYGGAPAVFLAPLALARLVRRRKDALPLDLAPIFVFPLVVALFFLFVSKAMPWYLLPLYPFLAVATGLLLDELVGAKSAPLRALTWAMLVTAFCTRTTTGDIIAFRMPAWRLDPELEWRGGIASLALVLALAAAPLLPPLRRALTTAPARLATTLALLTLLGFASTRTARMLGHLDWIAPIERQSIAVRASVERGEPLTYPLPIAGSEFRLAHFFYADLFRVRRTSGTPHVGVLRGLREPPRRPTGSTMPTPSSWTPAPPATPH